MDQNFTAKIINDNKHIIHIIQDPKHVLKKLRNNVQSSSIEHKSSPGRYLVCKGKSIELEHQDGAFTLITKEV